jgi:PEP-CTERM motif
MKAKVSCVALALALVIANRAAMATTIDLTVAPAPDGTVNGATFQQNVTQPTGTGVYDPFVRIQANGTEQGWNTDGAAPLDAKAGIWTHAIQLSSLVPVTIDGITYYVFGLDINEPNNSADRVLSLDSLQLYTASSGTITGDSLSALSSAANLRYDLDSGSDSTVLLNGGIAPGSGHDDLRVLVPTSLFGADSQNSFLYLYSLFGAQGNDCTTNATPNGSGDCTSAGGFEEWAAFARSSPSQVPEPNSLILLGSGLAGLGAWRMRRKNRA